MSHQRAPNSEHCLHMNTRDPMCIPRYRHYSHYPFCSTDEQARHRKVKLPCQGTAELGPAPGKLVLLHKTDYGALISKGDHKKFSPYSSFLLHPGKREVSRKGLLKMSLISQMSLFFLKSMSLCMEKRSPPPKSKKCQVFRDPS